MKKALGFLAFVMAFVLALPVNSINALLVNHEGQFVNLVFDSFDSFQTPDPNKPYDYWWRTVGSSIPQAGRYENQDCSPLNTDCLTIEQEGWNKFARHLIRPGKPAGSFYFSQLSDVRDAMSYGEEMRWKPEVNKPVVLTTRVRFSANYNDTGTGAANGTAGFGFWNMPTVLIDEPPYLVTNPTKALWFTYSESDMFGGFLLTGYSANWVDGFVPVEQSVRGVNLNDWTIQTIVWSQNADGSQNAKFYIGTSLVADLNIPVEHAFPALSLVSWVDSSKYNAFGQQVDGTPVEEQYMDMDYISVVQLGL